MLKSCVKRRASRVSINASRPVGTSLLQEVVYLVSQGADPDEIGLMNIDEQLPVLEYPQPGLDIIQVTMPDADHSRSRQHLLNHACCLCAPTGADVAAAHQEPPSLSVPPHGPARRRGQGQCCKDGGR